MITYSMESDRSLFDSMVDLMDLIRASRSDKYENAMIGPFEDYSLMDVGIIIDGKDERVLAKDFDRVLADKGRIFTRQNQFGVKFYVERTF